MYMCGWYTLKLGPGSGAEQQCKESQHSIASHHQTKDSADAGTCPPCGSHRSKILPWKIKKELKKTFQANWSVLSVAKLTGENRTVDAETHFPPPTPLPPIVVQPGRGSWVNSHTAALPETSIYGRAGPGTQRKSIAHHFQSTEEVP